MVDDSYVSGADTAAPVSAKPAWDDSPEVPEGRKKLVEQWLTELKDAQENPRIKKAFDRARTCMYISVNGAEKDWIDAKNFVVPIGPRHINMTVAKLFAKNPKVTAKRRRRLQFKLWDGKAETLAMAAAGQHPLAPQIMQEVAAAQDYERMVTSMGKALEILWDHFTTEQRSSFKLQMKAAVRRTKVCGAAYVRLGFQRALEPNPEVTQKIGDATDQIALIQARLDCMAAGAPGYEEDTAKLEELQGAIKALRADEMMVVREGPVFGFPKFHSVIIDPKCVHLKTLAGADYIAYAYDKTPEDGEAVWGVNVKNNFTPRSVPDEKGRTSDKKKKTARYYEVMDRKNGVAFVVCEGYPDFVKEPAPPSVKNERFFDLYPIVFNEVESEDELFPPSDLWQIRDPMAEYNRARQGLREHRLANRPKYATPQGALEDEDKIKLTSAPAHAIIEVNGLTPRDKIGDKIQRMEMISIDPNQYQVDESFKDILRAVGSQEANFGTTSGDTATEASIAENTQSASEGDNRDDLDEMLSDLARGFGQLCLAELSPDTVIEICGPGAVWPDAGMTRDEIQKDLLLDVRAGSSGRPNAQAEMAKLERAGPMLMQLPGVKPEPIVKKMADLIEIDVEEIYVEGLPSITAMNAAAGRPVGAHETGDPATDPNAQGPQGGQNAPVPAGNAPGPQPQYPGPQEATPQVA